MDIIIFGGQSNMQGQSESLTNTDVVPLSYEYKYFIDEIVPLKNPVGEDVAINKTKGKPFGKGLSLNEWLSEHLVGSSCSGNTNLVPEFCREYTEITGEKVLAVHVAKGSTEIAYWLPGNGGYEFLAEKSILAIKSITSDEVGRIFFVWLQGESDAIKGHSKNYYKEKIAELNDSLKKDVGIEKFCIIRVGCFTNDERDFEIISAQDEICYENDDFLMLTTIATELNKEPEFMNPFVSGHYSAKGLEKLGKEAGKTLGAFVSGN